MVVVSLFGGLGNQLFQYAAGRAVALRHKTTLKLDVTAFEVYKSRTYRLGRFNIHEEFAYAGPIARLFGQPTNRHLRRLRRYLPYFWLRTVNERHPFQFDPEIFSKGQNILLVGFWQNESYFRDFSDTLRQDLTVRLPPDKENAVLAETVQNVLAVSVHVRRADYVSDPHTLQTHGACSTAYYQTAIRELSASIHDPHFFIFSDDPEWARKNLRFEHPVTFVAHNGTEHDYEDLRLMTLCRHHIIANSSFSWWGAWLGANPGQIVIAPKRWLVDDTVNTSGLFPKEWQRL